MKTFEIIFYDDGGKKRSIFDVCKYTSEQEIKDVYRLTELEGLQANIILEDALYEVRPMKVCAWCLNILRDGALPVSHGICADCRENHFNL